MNWDDLDRFHQKVDRHGRMIRWLAVAVILIGMSAVCANLSNLFGAVDRIF